MKYIPCLAIASVILVSAVIASGCTSACVPVRPSALIPNMDGGCSVIIENVSFSYLHSCNEFKTGELNYIMFYMDAGRNRGDSNIAGVCKDPTIK